MFSDIKSNFKSNEQNLICNKIMVEDIAFNTPAWKSLSILPSLLDSLIDDPIFTTSHQLAESLLAVCVTYIPGHFRLIFPDIVHNR